MKGTQKLVVPSGLVTATELLNLWGELLPQDFAPLNWNSFEEIVNSFSFFVEPSKISIIHQDIPLGVQDIRQTFIYLDILNLACRNWKEDPNHVGFKSDGDHTISPIEFEVFFPPAYQQEIKHILGSVEDSSASRQWSPS